MYCISVGSINLLSEIIKFETAGYWPPAYNITSKVGSGKDTRICTQVNSGAHIVPT